MKIYELLDQPQLIITNEEHHFVETHTSDVDLDSLNERELVIAQNLVRKGLYAISNDSERIIKQGNEIEQESDL
jgi:hypothetical protein